MHTTKAHQPILYGLAKKYAAAKEVRLATVDPNTGVVTFLSNTSLSTGIVEAVVASDDANDRYYYYTYEPNDTRLNAVNLAYGPLLSYATLNFPAGYYFDGLSYDCTDTSFYGISTTTRTYTPPHRPTRTPRHPTLSSPGRVFPGAYPRSTTLAEGGCSRVAWNRGTIRSIHPDWLQGLTL